MALRQRLQRRRSAPASTTTGSDGFDDHDDARRNRKQRRVLEAQHIIARPSSTKGPRGFFLSAYLQIAAKATADTNGGGWRPLPGKDHTCTQDCIQWTCGRDTFVCIGTGNVHVCNSSDLRCCAPYITTTRHGRACCISGYAVFGELENDPGDVFRYASAGCSRTMYSQAVRSGKRPVVYGSNSNSLLSGVDPVAARNAKVEATIRATTQKMLYRQRNRQAHKQSQLTAYHRDLQRRVRQLRWSRGCLYITDLLPIVLDMRKWYQRAHQQEESAHQSIAHTRKSLDDIVQAIVMLWTAFQDIIQREPNTLSSKMVYTEVYHTVAALYALRNGLKAKGKWILEPDEHIDLPGRDCLANAGIELDPGNATRHDRMFRILYNKYYKAE